MLTYEIPPATFAEMQAAVRHYAERTGATEAESWAVLEERIAKELNRAIRRAEAAHQRRRRGA